MVVPHEKQILLSIPQQMEILSTGDSDFIENDPVTKKINVRGETSEQGENNQEHYAGDIIAQWQ